MIIGEVAFEDAHEVRFVENDHVSQAFSPDRSDQPFNIRRLPRRSEGCSNLLDAHVLDSLSNIIAVDRVAIPNEIFRRLIPRERFDQLLRRPYSCRVLGDVEMNDTTTVMA